MVRHSSLRKCRFGRNAFWHADTTAAVAETVFGYCRSKVLRCGVLLSVYLEFVEAQSIHTNYRTL